jgi:hypothetical protein
MLGWDIVRISDKLLYLATAAALISLIGTANAKQLVSLTDAQLDRVTAGAGAEQIPTIATFLVNGSNGAGGVNQFSPSIATLVPTITNLSLCIFCVTTK